MAANDEFIKMHGALQSSLLSRHFAFERYFRANHLALFNHLGGDYAAPTTDEAGSTQCLMLDATGS